MRAPCRLPGMRCWNAPADAARAAQHHRRGVQLFVPSSRIRGSSWRASAGFEANDRRGGKTRLIGCRPEDTVAAMLGMARDRLVAAAWGLLFTIILGGLIVVGSRNLNHF